jgi:hypothetical protein
MRIVVAAVHAAAADAVLVEHQLPKLGAHLATTRSVEEITWMKEIRGRKKAGDGGSCRSR